MDGDNLTVDQAAKELGVTAAAVSQMLNKELIPSEKIGRKRYIDRAIIHSVIDLKSQYGRRWAQHAPWNGGEGMDPVPDVPAGLNGKLLELARKFRSAGHPEIACKLQEILLDQYEF